MRPPSKLPDTPVNPLADSYRLVSWPIVVEVTGLTRVELYELMAAGKFPEPLRPVRNRTAVWPAMRISAWMKKNRPK